MKLAAYDRVTPVRNAFNETVNMFSRREAFTSTTYVKDRNGAVVTHANDGVYALALGTKH